MADASRTAAAAAAGGCRQRCGVGRGLCPTAIDDASAELPDADNRERRHHDDREQQHDSLTPIGNHELASIGRMR